MTLSRHFALKQPIASDVLRLNEWLDDVFRQAAIDNELAADIRLCVNEIIANLISYAFTQTPRPEVMIALDLECDAARVTVEDNGDYFDMRQWPDPEKPNNLATATIGGFGIALVRERARAINYERNGVTNRLTIVCSKEGNLARGGAAQ